MVKGRKLLSLLLTIALGLSLLPAAAWAEGDASEEWSTADVSAQVIQDGGFPSENAAKQSGMHTANIEGAKQALLEGLRAKSKVINVSAYQLTPEDCRTCYFSVINANPELFYVKSGFSYSYSGAYVTTVTPQYDDSYTDADIQRFHAVCDAIIARIAPTMNDEQKLLFLHDYLVTHCYYDQTYSRYNAYDALVDGTAVCQGYALAYTCLVKMAGLAAAPVVTSDSQNHAWNLVQLDGEKYYVDCTWDDPLNDAEYYCGHKNFLRSRDGMVGTGHDAGTDWVCDGANIYTQEPGGTKYDSYFWIDVTSALAMADGMYGYAKKSDNSHVFLRSAASGAETAVSIGAPAIWYVWGSSGSYWTNSYISVAAVGGRFYFNTPQKLYSLTTGGSIREVYELSAAEKTSGYIYGLAAEDFGLRYYLGQDPNQSNTFTSSIFYLSAPVSVVGAFDAYGALTATVTAPAGSLLIAASYDASGRAVGIRFLTVAEACEGKSVATGLTRQTGGACRLMLVDASTRAPLCAAWTGNA